MFGYVRPYIPELLVREKQRYDAWYCGLCRALGKGCGQLSRLTLSYDCAFLALLLSSAHACPSPSAVRACPVHPLARRKPMVERDNPALVYAADVCVILAKYKLDDDVIDGRPLRRAAKLPLLSAFRRAKKRRAGLYKAVGEQLRLLHAVEEEKAPSLDLAANRFGELMRLVLTGFAYGEPNEARERVLSELGYWLGRVIYLFDAWDDREKDEKKGLYNPFVLTGAGRSDAEFLINLSINEAISAYDLLELPPEDGCDRGVLENIFHKGLFAEWDRINSPDKPRKARKATDRKDG